MPRCLWVLWVESQYPAAEPDVMGLVPRAAYSERRLMAHMRAGQARHIQTARQLSG